jgi:hypothetical protein
LVEVAVEVPAVARGEKGTAWAFMVPMPGAVDTTKPLPAALAALVTLVTLVTVPPVDALGPADVACGPVGRGAATPLVLWAATAAEKVAGDVAPGALPLAAAPTATAGAVDVDVKVGAEVGAEGAAAGRGVMAVTAGPPFPGSTPLPRPVAAATVVAAVDDDPGPDAGDAPATTPGTGFAPLPARVLAAVDTAEVAGATVATPVLAVTPALPAGAAVAVAVVEEEGAAAMLLVGVAAVGTVAEEVVEVGGCMTDAHDLPSSPGPARALDAPGPSPTLKR